MFGLGKLLGRKSKDKIATKVKVEAYDYAGDTGTVKVPAHKRTVYRKQSEDTPKPRRQPPPKSGTSRRDAEKIADLRHEITALKGVIREKDKTINRLSSQQGLMVEKAKAPAKPDEESVGRLKNKIKTLSDQLGRQTVEAGYWKAKYDDLILNRQIDDALRFATNKK